MRRLIDNLLALVPALVLAALMSGCAAHARHVDNFVAHDVPLPTPVTCVPTLPPEPAYPDTPAQLLAAPDIFELAKLIKAGRIMRAQREREYKIALAACAGPVSK